MHDHGKNMIILGRSVTFSLDAAEIVSKTLLAAAAMVYVTIDRADDRN